jgi:hypothetical protein
VKEKELFRAYDPFYKKDDKKSNLIFYLIHERDTILEERKKLRKEFNVLSEDEPSMASLKESRPNLLRNPIAETFTNKMMNPRVSNKMVTEPTRTLESRRLKRPTNTLSWSEELREYAKAPIEWETQINGFLRGCRKFLGI